MKTDVSGISELSATGVYTLLLHVSKDIILTIGRLEKHIFSEGYYTYTWSALGKDSTCLKHRIARHQRKQKKNFWHIDYLLANKNVSIEAVIVAETTKKIECTINSYLKNLKGTTVPAIGCGACDCRKNCQSHLLYFQKLKNADCLIQKLVLNIQNLTGILSVTVID